MAPKPTRVYLEVVDRKAFACSVDWPGWCRAGRTPDDALEALAAYAPRYRVVADRAGVRFAQGAGEHLEVVETLAGNGTTQFGVPGGQPDVDAEPLTAAGARRMTDLLVAAWDVLDDVVAGSPESLRKGPRGGGRDRDKMLAHVHGSESGYGRQIGVKHPEPKPGDAAAVAALRGDLLTVLRAARSGEPLKENGWRPRYAARRIAWHALDHAWEMEDRRQ